MIAIIKTGGKQYIVEEDQTLKVELLAGKAGDSMDFEVLLRAEKDGSRVDVGSPVLKEAVKGEIVAHGRHRKISVVKYKPKVRYQKRVGHRQPFSTIKITKI
jgi:large subunit ribosomal protein L21